MLQVINEVEDSNSQSDEEYELPPPPIPSVVRNNDIQLESMSDEEESKYGQTRPPSTHIRQVDSQVEESKMIPYQAPHAPPTEEG